MDIKKSLDNFKPVEMLQNAASNDMSVLALKSVIIIWCLFVIGITLMTSNKWILSGILAYEVLP